ncbi:transposase [Proteiniphilum sp. X52]|uniref:transposase n=1 Tax=Proteiniphilum sp. X52 TaxID=2382159 RepID=UPI001C86ABBD|nr:transposase [Proteiniphilum sp. X52]
MKFRFGYLDFCINNCIVENTRITEKTIDKKTNYGNFHPKILALLRDQEMECGRLAGSLYRRGLTQSQVGGIFGEIYGEHYGKAGIPRMIDYPRSDVGRWLNRPPESY